MKAREQKRSASQGKGNARRDSGDARYRLLLVAASQIVSRLPNILIVWIVAYYCYQSIKAVAGQETDLKVILQAMADVKASTAVVGLAAVVFGSSTYGLYRARRRLVRQLGDLRSKYEKLLDPSRSSSNLTPEGDTRPEDR